MSAWSCNKRIGIGNGGFWNKRTSRDHLNNIIVEIGQNTERSPGDLRRFAVTQTPVRTYRLMLVWNKFQNSKILLLIKLTILIQETILNANNLQIQVGIKYHFQRICYDATWNWTPVSQTIREHSLGHCKLVNSSLYRCLKKEQFYGLAGCGSFSPSPPVTPRRRRWLWFVERYLMFQISP